MSSLRRTHPEVYRRVLGEMVACRRSGDRPSQNTVQARVRNWLKSVQFPAPCAYCGVNLGSRNEATVDHVRPLCRGGSIRAKNMCLSCRACNNRKANLTDEEFKVVWSAWISRRRRSLSAPERYRDAVDDHQLAMERIRKESRG